MNKVILYGKVMGDVDLRQTGSGLEVAAFSLGVSKKAKDGTYDNNYFKIVSIGKLAGVVKQYVNKDSFLVVDGKLQNRSWEDKKTGEKKYATDIIANEITFAK